MYRGRAGADDFRIVFESACLKTWMLDCLEGCRLHGGMLSGDRHSVSVIWMVGTVVGWWPLLDV